jgi:hypothetical protein
MRNIRLLMVVAALMVPVLWTGTLWAAEATDPVVGNADNLGDPGPGGGIPPEALTPATTENAEITGTVVGTNCWLARGLEGDQYRDSAVACARKGTPLSILTDAGELIYPVTVGNSGNYQPDVQSVLNYAEQRVQVTGKVIKRGKERAIVIDAIGPAEKPGKERTFAAKETPGAEVVGRVVDLDCWIVKGNEGTSDAKCVGDCAVAGDPLVIVTRDGRIYYPVSMTMPASPVGAAWLSGHCAQEVRATGTVIARGDGRGIIISSVAPRSPK